jgi:hypothetical protein
MQENEELETLNGNTDSSYELSANERKLIHIQVTNLYNIAAEKRYDEYTKVLILDAVTFMSMEASGHFNSYDKVQILHDGRIEAKQEAAEKVSKRKKRGAE